MDTTAVIMVSMTYWSLPLKVREFGNEVLISNLKTVSSKRVQTTNTFAQNKLSKHGFKIITSQSTTEGASKTVMGFLEENMEGQLCDTGRGEAFFNKVWNMQNRKENINIAKSQESNVGASNLT